MYSEKIIQSRNATFQLSNDFKGLNGGKCGWICRQLNKIRDFVVDIPIIGTYLTTRIDAALQVISYIDDVVLKLGSDYEPTLQEEMILNNWQLNKLQPFYRELALDLSDAFKQNSLTQQTSIVNEVLNKMCIVKTYFINNEKDGLSINAIQLRSNLIENIFEPLYEIIETSFANQNLTSISVLAKLDNSTIGDYYPLISGNKSLSTSCFNYKSNSTSSNEVPMILNDSTSTPQTVIKESNGNLLWIGLLVAGVLAITIFNDDNSTSEKKKIDK